MDKTPKCISILGSTGSIGQNALRLIDENPGNFRVVALCAGRNYKVLAEQALKHLPEIVSVSDEGCVDELRGLIVKGAGKSYSPTICYGEEGAIKAATVPSADTVLSAIVGSAGLKPTYSAVKKGKRVALANKESIVMAGRLLIAEAKRSNAVILPVDSEHSAIFQSMLGHNKSEIKRLILTASGGPFLGRKKSELKNVALKEVLNHPNWKMGKKVTIDSATLMNKALEVIEARWLFDISPDKISVMIHPQSIIHSIVEYRDGSMIAQMGVPDMRVPISYAMTYPERVEIKGTSLNLEKIEKLTFLKPDLEMFPALNFAYDALASADSMAVVLNSANEASVAAFICGKIGFLDIPRVIDRVIGEHKAFNLASVDEALELHAEYHLFTERVIEKL